MSAAGIPGTRLVPPPRDIPAEGSRRPELEHFLKRGVEVRQRIGLGSGAGMTDLLVFRKASCGLAARRGGKPRFVVFHKGGGGLGELAPHRFPDRQERLSWLTKTR